MLQPTMPPPTMTTLASLGRLEFTMGREFTCETFFHNAPFRGQRVRSRDVRYSWAVNLLSHLFLKAPLSAQNIAWMGGNLNFAPSRRQYEPEARTQ